MTSARRRSVVLGLTLGVAATMIGVGVLVVTRDDDGTTLTTPGGQPDTALPTAPELEGERLPDLTLEAFDGSERPLSAYEGTPVVLNVWSSTCAPCIKEMPAFERVHQELADQVRFVGINHQDRASKAEEMAQQTGVTYELLRDPLGDFASSLQLIGLPATVLATPEGEIVYAKTGELSEDELRSLIGERLLAAP